MLLMLIPLLENKKTNIYKQREVKLSSHWVDGSKLYTGKYPFVIIVWGNFCRMPRVKRTMIF